MSGGGLERVRVLIVATFAANAQLPPTIEEKSMSPSSFRMLLLIAPVVLCGTADVSWAEASAQKWPDQAQLKRQIEQCRLSKPPEGIPADQARAAVLDYESQCYRQLTEIQHAKLNALQDAVSRNRARKVADQTLLKREPLPKCQLSKPPEGIPENDARVAKLDYENQCYRQLAELEHGKLDALEEATRQTAKSPSPTHRIQHRRVTRRQPFAVSFQATR
jgi:hypothetical protein